MKREELDISTKTNIFEKNPTNGGTPARESRLRPKNFVKIFEAPRLENEYKVLKLVLTICIIVENSKKEVKL